MLREFGDQLLTYRSENMALHLFLESLLRAHPDRQLALAHLASQLSSTEGLALFRALPDEEIAAFRAAGERLLAELRRGSSPPSSR